MTLVTHEQEASVGGLVSPCAVFSVLTIECALRGNVRYLFFCCFLLIVPSHACGSDPYRARSLLSSTVSPNMMLVSAPSTNDLFQSVSRDEQIRSANKR